MKFQVTNVSVPMGHIQATIAMQSLDEVPVSDAPSVPTVASVINLTVPVTEAGNYVSGAIYDVQFTPVTSTEEK